MRAMGRILIIYGISLVLVGCQHSDSHTHNQDYGKTEVEQQIEVADISYITKSLTYSESSQQMTALDCRDFMDEGLWLEAIDKNLVYESDGDIVAGIIPHHGVACDYMTSFYQTVVDSNKKEPEVVLLIGPNHEAIGPRFQLGAFEFLTYGGSVKSDRDGIKSLIDGRYLTVGIEEVFQKEHSVGIHMHYIEHYFPSATVIPCIIGESHNMDGIGEVASRLANYVKDKNVVIIASIDFSHYLTLDEANERDEHTRVLIETSNIHSMIGLTSDYLDSPSSFGLLITLLDELVGDYQCKVIGHDNMASIWGNLEMKETTSYFQVSYKKVNAP